MKTLQLTEIMRYFYGSSAIRTRDQRIKSDIGQHPVCYKSIPCDAIQGEKQSKTVTITFNLVIVRHNNDTVILSK